MKKKRRKEKMPKKVTLRQLHELTGQAADVLISRQDLQELIQKGRKLALTRLLDNIIERVVKIAVRLPNDYQKARQLIEALELTEFGTSSRCSVANELKKTYQGCETWQEIEIEARRTALGVLTPKSAAFEQLWKKAATITDSFRKLEALTTIAMNSEDEKYCKAAYNTFLALVPKMERHNFDSQRYKLILAFLRINDFSQAERLATEIGDQGTKDTALTEIAVAIVEGKHFGYFEKADKLTKAIKHPFGRVRVFITFYNEFCREEYLEEARKALVEIQHPFFKVKALAEIAKARSLIPFNEYKEILPEMKELISEIRDPDERIRALTTVAVVSRREGDFEKALAFILKTNDLDWEFDLLLNIATGIKETLK